MLCTILKSILALPLEESPNATTEHVPYACSLTLNLRTNEPSLFASTVMVRVEPKSILIVSLLQKPSPYKVIVAPTVPSVGTMPVSLGITLKVYVA